MTPDALEILRKGLVEDLEAEEAWIPQERHDLAATMIAAAGHTQAAQGYLKRHVLSWPGCSAAERLVFVQSELEVHEDQVDEALRDKDQAPEMALALARTATPWAHDTLDLSIKTHRDTLAAVALVNVLALEDRRSLERLLDQTEDAIQLVNVLRAAVLLELPFEFDFASFHRHCVEEKVFPLAASVEALWALHHPPQYARALLAGEVDFDFTQYDQPCADVLQRAGESSWLETLALLGLTRQQEPRQFACQLAMAAALTCISPLEASPKALLGLLESRGEGDDWMGRALELGLSLGVAAADEEHSVLVVEACAHELLLRRDEPSCGIGGLPLSGNVESAEALEAALDLFRGFDPGADPSYITAMVRTLVDARRWHDEYEVEAIASWWQDNQDLFLELCEHENSAVRLAANRLGLSLDPGLFEAPEDLSQALLVGPDHPGARAHFEAMAKRAGMDALWAIEQLGELATEDAVAALGGVWAEANPWRAAQARETLWGAMSDGEFL